ncbi:hypothetical protein BDQ12DRAFT_716058 [Crucibulum laeve]|uniref:Uncharacterized protein n=1 Tax=Crucibulum laeve TaxID=68775 RepID=A0A5C3LJZ5_9AGAR|nr:hypothetical protein BDQ12DRAFT_716058 [Crucibulum laeve]
MSVAQRLRRFLGVSCTATQIWKAQTTSWGYMRSRKEDERAEDIQVEVQSLAGGYWQALEISFVILKSTQYTYGASQHQNCRISRTCLPTLLILRAAPRIQPLWSPQSICLPEVPRPPLRRQRHQTPGTLSVERHGRYQAPRRLAPQHKLARHWIQTQLLRLSPEPREDRHQHHQMGDGGSNLPELTTFHGVKFFYENNEIAGVLAWKYLTLRRMDHWEEGCGKVVVLLWEGAVGEEAKVKWDVRRVKA